MLNTFHNSQKGLLRCAYYAFMPNRLTYCGPDRNKELFDYAVAGEQDGGLQNNLKEFAALYPYLKLIAHSNKIADPFDERVVEAYWIGNELLESVKMNRLYEHLVDEQKLKKKLNKKVLDKVVGKIPMGAKPHHSFHVLNIPKRTGHVDVGHSVETLDKCRISWGQVLKRGQGSGIPPIGRAGRDQGEITIKIRPLKIENNKLVLGNEIEKEVRVEISGKGFVKDLQKGDWVSVHWGWVCERLSESQVRSLEVWTKYHLALLNLTL